MIRKLFLLLLFISTTFNSLAQYQFQRLNHVNDARLNAGLYDTDVNSHTSVRPLNRWSMDSLDVSPFPNLRSGFKQWVWRKLFYEHLVKIKQDDYELTIDPVVNLRYSYEMDDPSTLYTSTRGFAIEGRLGQNFTFTSSFLENQARFPRYIQQFAAQQNVVPGQGYARPFGGNALDFAMASGEISYSPNATFSFTAGQGRNFFGEGYRSMVLSDVAFNYPFFRIHTSFWKIKYTNVWAQMYDVRDAVSPNGIFAKKYLSTHYLSFNVNSRWNISLFESIILGDSTQQRGLDASFFNPVILYRPVEFAVGSGAGNALLGFGSSYKLKDGLMAYGQLLLDEFTFSEFFSSSGYWANKFSYQLGLKYYNAFGIKGLFGRLEYNGARPYTYTHFQGLSNYGHYGQPLAHPWGANFRESLSRWFYHHQRWEYELVVHYGQIGLDRNGQNWGSDIYKPYDTREQEYNNVTTQGTKADLWYVLVRAGWLINPASGLKIEAGAQWRSLGEVSAGATRFLPAGQSTLVFLGLRTEFFNRYFDM